MVILIVCFDSDVPAKRKKVKILVKGTSRVFSSLTALM